MGMRVSGSKICMLGLILCVSALAMLAGCGSAGSSHGSASTTTTSGDAVTIKNYTFTPSKLKVAEGTAVKFTNSDATNHTATATAGGAFDTGTIGKGQTKMIVLKRPGTYVYQCSFHPFMKGTITVQP